MFKKFLKSIGNIREKTVITGPLNVTHEVHVDKELNWTFDSSVDPKTIFSKLKVIGQGGFGTVSTILHKPSMKVLAGKLINPTLVNDNSKEELEHEIQLMRAVDSKYTVRYYGCVQFEGSLMILMEYCDKGSLRDLLDARQKVMSEDQISIVMSDLLKGMKLIHEKFHIIHRDIKAANLLLTGDLEIKIADFGVSRQFDSNGSNTVTIVGTPYWMAPEVICGVPYSYPADIWSIGMTAVEMSEGAPPYVEYPPTKAMINIATKGFPGYRFPDLHSEEFTDFVSLCAVKEQDSRASIDKLLEHPFIKRAERLDRKVVLGELLEEPETKNEEKQEEKSNEQQTFSAPDDNEQIDSDLMKSNKPIDSKNISNVDSFNDFANPMMDGYNSFEATGEGFGSFQATGEGFNSFQATGEGCNSFEATGEGFGSFEATGEGFNSFEATGEGIGTFQQTKQGPVDDKTFIKTAKIMSSKIPFTPVSFGTNPDAPLKTLYSSGFEIKKSNELPPLFDRDGVISLETAYRHPKAPLYLSSLLVFIAYLFFGREGFILLLSLAFFVHIVISVSERQQSMIDPQKKTNDLESKAEGKEQSK